MATDYEEFYRSNRHGLGEPTSEFVTFFDSYERETAIFTEVADIREYKSILDASQWNWTMTLERRGFLFVQRD